MARTSLPAAIDEVAARDPVLVQLVGLSADKLASPRDLSAKSSAEQLSSRAEPTLR